MKTDPIARTYQARPLDSGTGRSKGTETVVRIIASPLLSLDSRPRTVLYSCGLAEEAGLGAML